MSTPTEQQMSRMLAAKRPTRGSRKPRRDINSTLRTKAEEMGLESEIPVEMPFTIKKSSTRPRARRMKPTGWWRMVEASTVVTVPQNKTHSTKSLRLTRWFGGTSWGASFIAPRMRCTASQAIWLMSTNEAPRIMASAMRKPILRKGSSGAIQPHSRSEGVRAHPITPMTRPGMAMRWLTIIPAPRVEAVKLPNRVNVPLVRPPRIPVKPAVLVARTGQTKVEAPPTIPPPMPPPSLMIEALSSRGSVRARMIVATAAPEGYVSCNRSTRRGV